jgi:hypothetical protein
MGRTVMSLGAYVLFLVAMPGAAGCGTSVGNAIGSATRGSSVSQPTSSSKAGASTGLDAGVGTNFGGGDAAPTLVGISATGDASTTAPTTTADPQTCAEAAQAHTYVGCDYWPTVVANNVWTIFDFAAVVANAGTVAADVTVTGPMNTNQTVTVPPGQLAKIYLPWVPALKGPAADNCGAAAPLTDSVLATGGAFHLVSTVPVTVYQFNALEYQGVGGPAGKDWSTCPGLQACIDPAVYLVPVEVGCFSFSNDASLLLPSTAMTGNYRVVGHEGTVETDPTTGQSLSNGGYMAITATADATTVTVTVSSAGQIAAGTGVAATNAGGTLTLTLNAGDVAQLLGPGGSDLSGSIVQASAPVQVITGNPCYEIPPGTPACDHMEESVLPAETFGKDYVVTRPAGPSLLDGGGATEAPVPHQVRFYGNSDNTNLTSNPAVPAGCPTTLSAGQVVECGVGGACPTTINVADTYTCGVTDEDFEVTGDQPFAVATFTLGATLIDPLMIQGDPAQTSVAAVEQYRSKYVFLAPEDYIANFVDIVAMPGTVMTIDDQDLVAEPQAIGTSAYSVYRAQLGPGQLGAHVLIASQPVGLQVVGYGAYTSYRYPGGLNLAQIAAPPPPPR